MPSPGPTSPPREIEELRRYLVSLRGPDGALKKPEYVGTFPELPEPKEK